MSSQHTMTAQQPSPRQIRIAVLLTAALLLAILVWQVVTSEMRDYDFHCLYAAGQIVRGGRGARLYDPAEQARAEEAIVKLPGPPVRAYAITHPPFEALLFALFARLSYAGAYLVWGIINILLWMVFANIARSFAPVPRQTLQYMLLCFAFFPLWATLIYGQTTFFLLLLYALTYLSLERRQDFRAGAFLGLGLCKFQLVLPFVLICLVRRKWRMMAGFAGVALLLGGLSVAAVGVRGVVSYVTFLVRFASPSANSVFIPILPSVMPTVRGVLSVLLAGRLGAKWVNGAVALVSGLLILFTGIWWQRKDRLEGNASLGLMFAAALAVTLMTGFHLLVNDLALLPLAVFLAIGSPQWSRKTPWRALLNVSIAIFYLPPVYILLARWDRRYLLFVPLLAFALALFGLLRQPAGGVE